jgi:hypothetical protein
MNKKTKIAVAYRAEDLGRPGDYSRAQLDLVKNPPHVPEAFHCADFAMRRQLSRCLSAANLNAGSSNRPS